MPNSDVAVISLNGVNCDRSSSPTIKSELITIFPPSPPMALAVISLFKIPRMVSELIVMFPPSPEPPALAVICEFSSSRLSELIVIFPPSPEAVDADIVPSLFRLIDSALTLRLPAFPVPML